MKINLFDIGIDNFTMEETLEKIEEFINSGKPHQHIVVNVNKVIKANKDKELRKIINNCDIVNVDGLLLVWASKLLRKPLKERVAGIDLFMELIKVSVRKEWKPYFLGAKVETLKKAIDVLIGRYPLLKLAGYRDGYWQKDEEKRVVEDIRISRPDILFIGISSPKKEYCLSRYLKDMQVPFAMGVGGSFDVFAGDTKRAPLWMQNCGLEWLFRFFQEPKRLFKRYFIVGPCFIKILWRELVRHD